MCYNPHSCFSLYLRGNHANCNSQQGQVFQRGEKNEQNPLNQPKKTPPNQPILESVGEAGAKKEMEERGPMPSIQARDPTCQAYIFQITDHAGMQNNKGTPPHQLLRYSQYLAKIMRIMGEVNESRGNLIWQFKGQGIDLSNYKT